MTTVRLFSDGGIGFGITLPVQAQTTLAAEPWESSGGAAEILRIARAAEGARFQSVSASDHVAIPRHRVATMSTTWFDPIATLAAVAAVTGTIRLFTRALILPFRPPLLSAKAVATLDALSGGRVVLGVGAGHIEEEFRALGVDFARRGALLDEAIDVVTAALSEEFPEVETSTWAVRDLGLGPRPVQRPRPPIWVGGSSRPALRRAAARADGWFQQVPDRDELPSQVSFLREERERVRPGDPVEVGASSEPVYIGTPSWDVGAGTVSGPPERVAASLRQLVDRGAQHVQVRFRSRSCGELEDQLAAFAAEVRPRIR